MWSCRRVPVSLAPKIGSTIRRVCTAVRMLLSPPVPAMLKRPMPSMKNGRFSEKKIGNRWLTWTWNAIAFDLAEVGIDRAVERDVRRDAELAADADMRVVVALGSTPIDDRRAPG